MNQVLQENISLRNDLNQRNKELGKIMAKYQILMNSLSAQQDFMNSIATQLDQLKEHKKTQEQEYQSLLSQNQLLQHEINKVSHRFKSQHGISQDLNHESISDTIRQLESDKKAMKIQIKEQQSHISCLESQVSDMEYEGMRYLLTH